MGSEVGVDVDEGDDVVELIERPDATYQVMSSVRGFAPWVVHGNDLGSFLFAVFVYLPYRWLVGTRRGYVVAAYRVPRHLGFHRPVAVRVVPSEAAADTLTSEWVDACKAGQFDRATKLPWWSRRRQLGVDLASIATTVLLVVLAGAFFGVVGLLLSLPDQLF